MKAKYVGIFGLGILAGLLLAPKKGKEIYEDLKIKSNDLYLQAKELNIDSIKDKIEDIKIEVSKLDLEKSKEIVSNQSLVIKEKLIKLVDDLQENKEIQPALEKAIDATQKTIIDVLDYIDENDLIDKTKENAQKVYGKSEEYVSTIKEKANDLIDKATNSVEQVNQVIEDELEAEQA